MCATESYYQFDAISETSLRPLQIDFLFPVLAKQNLACGRAGGKFHYSIMLTTTIARSLIQLKMLCTCLFTKLQGRQYMFNKYFMVSSRQQQAVHITFPSCLIRIQKNNHVIVRKR